MPEWNDAESDVGTGAFFNRLDRFSTGVTRQVSVKSRRPLHICREDDTAWVPLRRYRSGAGFPLGRLGTGRRMWRLRPEPPAHREWGRIPRMELLLTVEENVGVMRQASQVGPASRGRRGDDVAP
jgi:hypothetical protein